MPLGRRGGSGYCVAWGFVNSPGIRCTRTLPQTGEVAQVAFSCKEGCAYSEVKLF